MVSMSFIYMTRRTDSQILLVCKSNDACVGFPLAGGITGPGGSNDVDTANMTCYTGGETVFSNHQMCDVTSMCYFTISSPRGSIKF